MTTAERECFHCGLPVPAESSFLVEIDGRAQPMCCPGCAAVAKAIVAGGFSSFYRFRTSRSARPEDTVPDFMQALASYDNPTVQQRFVRSQDDGLREASLILSGINCAACVWLNERHLRALPGVVQAQVNYATRRARVVWDPQLIRLSRILGAIREIGYQAYPYDPARLEALAQQERKQQLKRIGVAGALGMQIMMIATALYFGNWSGIDPNYRTLFHWVSLFLCVPILLYSARPFFAGAWRDVRRRRAGMDLPVTLGLGIAFSGSVWATWSGAGQVYYESVAMFVFLLLSARYFELVARQRGAATLESLSQSLPQTAVRLDHLGQEQTVLAQELERGDLVRVRPGATIPADGVVRTGHGSTDESLLSGESRPIPKAPGDPVMAGSVNLEQPLQVAVTEAADTTVLSRIVRLAEQAQAHKPRLAALSDRVASGFIGAVLVLALAVSWYWWQRAPEQWLAVVISVLVVTCPCALSLATPAALSAALGRLTGLGVVAARADALEQLPKVTRFVFDKTGTLTQGSLQLVSVQPLAGYSRDRVMAIAAALERHSSHPIGRALRAACPDPTAPADDIHHTAGGGLSGTLEGQRYHLGNLAYLHAQVTALADIPEPAALRDSHHTLVYLADERELLAILALADELREDAAALIQDLRQLNIAMTVYSGDRETAVAQVAANLGIADFAGDLSPTAKLQRIRELQAAGEVVAAMGDGINDAPILAAAQVSIAMGSGADLARNSADLILMNDRLGTVSDCLQMARRTRAVIRQNLIWALAYNLLALPAAAMGMVPPWLAAIGMSTSSLLVVANALRLTRYADRPLAEHRDTTNRIAYA